MSTCADGPSRLCEDRSPPAAAIQKFAQLARDDRSPVVHLYLASALQRLDPGARWSIASGLMAHAEDASDHNLPKMLWFGVEPLVAANPALALDYAGRSRMPMLARFIARRAVDADAVDAAVAASKSRLRPRTTCSSMRDGLTGATMSGAGRMAGSTRVSSSDAARPPRLGRQSAVQRCKRRPGTCRSFAAAPRRSMTAAKRQTLTLQRRPSTRASAACVAG
jgi:hypothetical protein